MTPIPVGVPSHTPLLRGASEKFGAFLRDLGDVRTPDIRLLSGIDGAAVFDVDDNLDKLGQQVARTVDWAACMEACRAAGALELRHGADDGGHHRRRDSRGVADFHSLDGVIRWARYWRLGRKARFTIRRRSSADPTSIAGKG